jgi:hypothetical protein
MKSVTYLRIDGVNAAGRALHIHGDFAGGATADDLTHIVWEKSDSHGGEYLPIEDANGAEYTPEAGGYYLRVRAALGDKSFKSAPLYIRENADAGFVKAYLSDGEGCLTAAVVYHNELSSFNAEVRLTVYSGSCLVKTFSACFEAKQGSDMLMFTFPRAVADGERAELTVTSCGRLLCEPVEVDRSLPLILIHKTDECTTVSYDENEPVCIFKENRYMRFRPTAANDHWIGTEHNPVDMGFAYNEQRVKGLINTDVRYTAARGAFKIVFIGEKAMIDARQKTVFIGFWDKEKAAFSYIYDTMLDANTEIWYQNSKWSLANQHRVEAFDYHLERMSILDRVFNKNLNGNLYHYVVYENGKSLTRIPKLPIPYPLIKGTFYYGFFPCPGESVYYPDPKEGGWKATLLGATGSTYIEICWSWYDIHNVINDSVPQIGHSDRFSASQSWLFTPTTAAHDSALVDGAEEVPYKDQPNYQMPMFSTDNTFDKTVGGTDWQYAWWKKSYDCSLDMNVGHDAPGSAKIEKTTEGELSWFTEGVWGFPYSFDDVLGKTYRLSGYIKTEGVVGEAYIANKQYQHATPNDYTLCKSESVTGTNDWTYVSVTFVAQERSFPDGSRQRCIDHFYLTLNGTGRVWFDDVKIEEV